MKEILFGVAFGQLLAMAILVTVELFLSLLFWGFAELLWKSLISGARFFTVTVAEAEPTPPSSSVTVTATV